MLVLTDPPYGITACEWDKLIDLEKFWVEIKRIIKPNGAIVMTASQPFTTDLINSNREMFKYELIWDKKKGSNIMSVKNMPLKSHENILVFYNIAPTYNPQKTNGHSNYDKRKFRLNSKTFGMSDTQNNSFCEDGSRYPKSILTFSKNWQPQKSLHSTQKPVGLFKWLIKTYSNENQLVLDCFGGSGTTAIACIETNRKYILFENNPQYFKIINDRIKSAKSQTKLPNGSFPTESLICVKEENQK